MNPGGKPTTTDRTSQVPAPPNYDQPDWASRVEDVACPLCAYNLRGLVEPRCPECGYQFTWPDLLDPARRKHPYLFEVHPRSNFKSFWKTAFHGLRPGKFWRTLRADQKTVPGRLFLYWLIVAAVTLVGVASEPLFSLASNYISYRYYVASLATLIRGYRGNVSFQSQITDEEFNAANLFSGTVAVAVLAWPWLTFASLMIFRVSMRRAKIKAAHVVRCIVYCSDVALCAAIPAVLINVARLAKFACEQNVSRNPFFGWNETYPGTYWLWPVAALIFVIRLMYAYARYLRFPHVIATIVATQIIVVLAIAAIVLNIYFAFSGQ